MMPSWPTELSKPLSDAFQRQRGESRNVTRSEQGPPRVRRSTSKATETVQIALYLTHDQLARFHRFHDEECDDGALPFLMPGWGKRNQPMLTAEGLRLLTDDDTPILIDDTWPCLFGQSRPNEVVMGLEWRLTVDVVILP